MKQPLRLVVKPGPRHGWGRVDLPTGLSNSGEFYVRELGKTLKVTGVSRYQKPCLMFPLTNGVRVGNMVTVEEVLKCKTCGRRVSAVINGLCDRCYNWYTCGDMVSPPYAALIRGRGG
jgi:hypothetical protein